MKAILKFDLPDEEINFDMANNAVNYYSSLMEFDNYIRNQIKYGEKYNKREMILLENVRAEFITICQEYNVKL